MKPVPKPTRAVALAAALATVALIAGCAGPEIAASGPGVRDTAAGKVLVDAEGMTLYTYDRDPAGGSVCTGSCAFAWPPAEASEKASPAGGFSLVTRPDGAKQWAYRDKPLYGYTSDSRPGEMKGEGKGGVWHVAHP